MRIAVNTRLLLPNRLEGLGTFTHEVLRRMVKAHPEHEFIFLFDRPLNNEFIYSDNVTPVFAGPPARHAVLFVYWFEIVVPRLLKKYNADLFLSPDGYLSLRSQVKQIAVMHDLNFEHHPEFFKLSDRLHFRNFFSRFAKKATRIATVSEFSKKDIVEKYKINAGKIDVVYNGVDEMFKPADENEISRFKKEVTGGKDYFVFVGALYPRKNLINAIKAFDKFKALTGSEIKFLLVGKKYRESDELFHVHRTLNFKKDIIFLGRVEPREKLSVLLSGAIGLIYVSFYEGFGLPIIEAMKCETAVITSNITAMPEIADDAALFVNPFDVDEIVNAMKKLHDDNNLRKELVSRGKNIALKYSWERTAHLLWNCIIKTNN